ncbi:late embryogenesis abundant protein D-34-like [Hevea brasiliensis]|uniref:late embryogenesis abundant protein D-34-like n=1 Tax=Hevea brasiliensis TaxID=3981 RepID=UPI0025DD228F|nr:late embryogenesis abundant protein D-34-like [Hevea brasiliensis]
MNDESKTTLSDVLAVYVDPRVPAASPGSALGITIGEALEATAYSATGDKPVDQSDAAAIKAVEVRAPRSNETPSTGIGAQAQSAADLNTRLMNDESKTTLSDVLAVYVDPRVPAASPGSALGITIGEALEATAYSTTGDKPVDRSDAAAIKAVEVRAPRSNETPSTGIGAQAQSAADLNTRLMNDESKTTLSDVLADATTKLPRDNNDTEGMIGAELRNKPDVMRTTPGGVAASMAAAARLNHHNFTYICGFASVWSSCLCILQNVNPIRNPSSELLS